MFQLFKNRLNCQIAEDDWTNIYNTSNEEVTVWGWWGVWWGMDRGSTHLIIYKLIDVFFYIFINLSTTITARWTKIRHIQDIQSEYPSICRTALLDTFLNKPIVEYITGKVLYTQAQNITAARKPFHTCATFSFLQFHTIRNTQAIVFTCPYKVNGAFM